MWFGRAYIASVRGGDKDCVMGVSSLANEEPLVVVKSGVNVMGEIIRQNGCDGGNCMIRDWKTSLCCGGDWCICEGSSCV